jgi:putative endonuclease
MSQYPNNIGKLGEQKALLYLKDKGYKLLDKNFKSKFGEIDIIVSKDDCVYFIEVKTRTNTRKGMPYEAVNYTKIKHIYRAANYYLLKNDYKDYKLKIGVISILIINNGVEIKFWDNVSY